MAMTTTTSAPLGFCNVCTDDVFNAAYGKATAQSSDYNYLTTSDKAVDGNFNPDFNAWSCSCTLFDDATPWWSVDLGLFFTVAAVLVTNRNIAEERLHDLTVTIHLNDGDSGTVCGTHPGAVGRSATAQIQCGPGSWGRYVKISKVFNGLDDLLTICEVQVMAVKNTRVVFKKQPSEMSNASPLATMTTDVPGCARSCKDTMECSSFNHNRLTSQCNLLKLPMPDDVINDQAWSLYRIMY